MEDLVNQWQGRRVFLTGHTGFKGSWLSLWLFRLGSEVRGYALEPETSPAMFTEASVAEVLDDVRGDICDRASLESAMVEFAPEVVFHLAAQPLVRRSYADPLGTYGTNVMGTAHVLEAVRKTPSVRAVVCVTTDKVYQNQEWPWPYRETDALGGYDPYASSKACAEIVAAAYCHSYFSPEGVDAHRVALATARGGNVIGGGDWSEDRLVPDLIRGFQARQPVLIRRPAAIRPWQHVLDLLHGYIKLAERLLSQPEKGQDAFNFGPSEEDTWPVEHVAATLAEMWGEGASWTRDPEAGPHEAHFLKLDASRARAELGWLPCLRIENALQWTVDWYRARQRGLDMRDRSLLQIERYCSLANVGRTEGNRSLKLV
jgi:CDP-glucose 4,6-dehydratase